ncbi:hypothetical protein VPH35_105544 [Triticum aestivum]
MVSSLIPVCKSILSLALTASSRLGTQKENFLATEVLMAAQNLEARLWIVMEGKQETVNKHKNCEASKLCFCYLLYTNREIGVPFIRALKLLDELQIPWTSSEMTLA